MFECERTDRLSFRIQNIIIVFQEYESDYESNLLILHVCIIVFFYEKLVGVRKSLE